MQLFDFAGESVGVFVSGSRNKIVGARLTGFKNPIVIDGGVGNEFHDVAISSAIMPQEKVSLENRMSPEELIDVALHRHLTSPAELLALCMSWNNVKLSGSASRLQNFVAFVEAWPNLFEEIKPYLAALKYLNE